MDLNMRQLQLESHREKCFAPLNMPAPIIYPHMSHVILSYASVVHMQRSHVRCDGLFYAPVWHPRNVNDHAVMLETWN